MEANAKKDSNPERIDNFNRTRLYEVMDINFGFRRNKGIDLLTVMDGHDRERHRVMAKMRALKEKDPDAEIPAAMEEKVIDLYRKYNEAKHKYIDIQNE